MVGAKVWGVGPPEDPDRHLFGDQWSADMCWTCTPSRFGYQVTEYNRPLSPKHQAFHRWYLNYDGPETEPFSFEEE